MADFDYITILLPTIFASVITFVVLGIKKLGSASEGTLSGTIKLENVEVNIEGLEKKVEKGFDHIEELIDKNDRENRLTFSKVWARFEEMGVDVKLHEYRLDQVERHKRNGGTNGAV